MSSHAQPSPSDAAAEGSTRCDCCKSCGAVLELDGCGHRFHARCIYAFPVTQCELCAAPVAAVKIFRLFQNAPNSMVRKGKWSADEHKYANMMMKQFQMGAVPLVDGLHLRGFIANLLQCDPLRVTKKYSGHAIGKQNFYYQRHKSYCYNLHTKMQKRISSLRNHFYWHIQYRCKFGYSMNIQELKAAEADYWVKEFLKFATKIGQRVEMAAAPAAFVSPVPSPAKEMPSRDVSMEDVVVVASHQERTVELPSARVVAAQRPSVVKVEKEEQDEEQELPQEQDHQPVTKPFPPPASPIVTVSLAIDTQAKPEDAQFPTFKVDATHGAVSPLSFDEWREEEAPSFIDMLDKTLLADFAKQGSQFSATLSEILGPQAKAATATSSATPASLSQTPPSGASSRCSLRDWLVEEETRWNDSLPAASWSFSLTLSDCV